MEYSNILNKKTTLLSCIELILVLLYSNGVNLLFGFEWERTLQFIAILVIAGVLLLDIFRSLTSDSSRLNNSPNIIQNIIGAISQTPWTAKFIHILNNNKITTAYIALVSFCIITGVRISEMASIILFLIMMGDITLKFGEKCWNSQIGYLGSLFWGFFVIPVAGVAFAITEYATYDPDRFNNTVNFLVVTFTDYNLSFGLSSYLNFLKFYFTSYVFLFGVCTFLVLKFILSVLPKEKKDAVPTKINSDKIIFSPKIPQTVSVCSKCGMAYNKKLRRCKVCKSVI